MTIVLTYERMVATWLFGVSSVCLRCIYLCEIREANSRESECDMKNKRPTQSQSEHRIRKALAAIISNASTEQKAALNKLTTEYTENNYRRDIIFLFDVLVKHSAV